MAKEDRRGKYHCCLMYDTFIHNAKFLGTIVTGFVVRGVWQKSYLAYHALFYLHFFTKDLTEIWGCFTKHALKGLLLKEFDEYFLEDHYAMVFVGLNGKTCFFHPWSFPKLWIFCSVLKRIGSGMWHDINGSFGENSEHVLVGGLRLRHVLCSSLPGEMIQFD